MTQMPRQFREDKALRDAAKAVLDADLAHFKASLEQQGIGGRIADQLTGKFKRRITAGAKDTIANAKQQASDHPGALAAIIAAIILWLARQPLLRALGLADPPPVPQADPPQAAPETPDVPYPPTHS